MQIVYKNKGLERVCTIAQEANKKHGQRMAEIIHLRIDQIVAAASFEELIRFRIGGCHVLQGNRREQYAMDLVHPFRLVFVKCCSTIQLVRIVEIIDYH